MVYSCDLECWQSSQSKLTCFKEAMCDYFRPSDGAFEHDLPYNQKRESEIHDYAPPYFSIWNQDTRRASKEDLEWRCKYEIPRWTRRERENESFLMLGLVALSDISFVNGAVTSGCLCGLVGQMSPMGGKKARTIVPSL